MIETLKQEAQRLLSDVPEENVFWVNGGRIIHNLKELGEELKTMTEDTYVYHANGQKNDFTNWVRDVLGDEMLAANLGRASTRAQAARKYGLSRHLKEARAAYHWIIPDRGKAAPRRRAHRQW
jgi:hypothetical protein